jgi:protein O-mannosyl-transferase
LAVLTLLLYAPAVRHHEFINFDDPGYISEAHVQRGLSIENARWALTTFQFANWHPLTWMSHMSDVSLFGGDNAGAHHVVNAVLHAINAVLLYLVLRAMTGRTWASVAVAAIWAAHPLRVESVAWVAERKDLLSGMFFLLAIGCYARYARRASWAAYAGALVCFVLGLMSKPMIVTLPFVMLLVDCWPLKRQARVKRLFVEKIPFFVLAAAAAVVTYVAQRHGGAMGMGEPVSPMLRIENAFAAAASYLWLTIWPSGLTIFYPYYGALSGTSLSPVRIIAGVSIILIGTAIGVMMWRRERAVLVGWLWFLGTLVPVIGLVQVGRQSMADRYTYIPHIGLFIAIVWGVAGVAGVAASIRNVAMQRAAGVVAGVVVVALAMRTVDQLGYWKNSETLFTHALAVTHHNHIAHANLAFALGNRGDVAGAVEHYRRAIEIAPREPQPYYNIGQLYLVAGDFERAREWLERAVALDPNYADAHGNLAKAFASMGRPEDAIREFREVVRLRPTNDVAHYDLAVELAKHGEVEEALTHFAEAARLNPDSPQVFYSQSLALSQAGRAAEADSAYKRYEELAGRRGVTPLPIPPRGTTQPFNP